MIQILGLRPWFDPKTQKWKKKEEFFDRKWRAPSVPELLADPLAFLAHVPLEERFNLYFTVANCHELPGRKLAEQWTLPFDIDDVPQASANEVLFRATQALGLVSEQVGSLYSGHGVQFFIQLQAPIDDTDYFEQARSHYKALCDKIQKSLKAYALPGTVDVSVWSPARLMRMPATINRKPEKGDDVEAYVINTAMPAMEFRLEERSGLPIVKPGEAISKAHIERYPEVDAEAVEAGCEFLKWTKAEPAKVKEFQWYALLSVVGRLPNGEAKAIEYSQGHPGFSVMETKEKLHQAMEASGPRTCKNICGLWDGCHKCAYWDKINSPINIQGENYVKTKSTGFHDVVMDKFGNPRPGKPNVTDLWKFFQQQHTYIMEDLSKVVYKFNGTHWVEFPQIYITHFADQHFAPPVGSAVRNEFVQKCLCNNLHPTEWFLESTEGKINFRNGVLDLKTMELRAHSPDYGFRYVLDYDYDPEATSPRFDQFMDEIMEGNQDFKRLLLEFGGYAFSNDDCWLQAACFMVGTGSNGKSTFMDLLKAMAGKGNYSEVMMGDLQDPANRMPLEGSLFNISEETGLKSMIENSFFKTAVSGGAIVVKRLYSQPYSIRNRAKLFLSCNELPLTNDTTFAMFRRMVIIPFNATFTIGENAEIGIKGKLMAERAGIFNRFMDAYYEAKKAGRLSKTAESQRQIEEYREEVDFAWSWFTDNYDIQPAATSDVVWMGKTELYTAYAEAAKFEQGERALSQIAFWRKIGNSLRDLKKREHRKFDNDGKQIRVIGGIVKKTHQNKEQF